MSPATEAAVLTFLNNLRDPEGFGHSVTQEVRAQARTLVRAILLDSSPSPPHEPLPPKTPPSNPI